MSFNFVSNKRSCKVQTKKITKLSLYIGKKFQELIVATKVCTYSFEGSLKDEKYLFWKLNDWFLPH